jgi:hypothetical protein
MGIVLRLTAALLLVGVLAASIVRQPQSPAGKLRIVAGPVPAFPGANGRRGPALEYVSAGAAAVDGPRWILVYHRASGNADAFAWEPHLAISEDGGRVWQDYGRINLGSTATEGVYVTSLLRHEDAWWAFYNRFDQEAKLYYIEVARSDDLIHWSGQWRPTLFPGVTNACVVKDDDAWYMFTSEWLYRKLGFRLRLFKAQELTGVYRDCGVVVSPGTQAPAWCRDALWDSEVFKLGGRWYIWFGGAQKPGENLTAHGYAVADRITGPYTVAPEPLLRWSSVVGGRAAHFPLSPQAVRIFTDVFYPRKLGEPSGIELVSLDLAISAPGPAEPAP